MVCRIVILSIFSRRKKFLIDNSFSLPTDHMPLFAQMKSISTSTPNTPLHLPKPHLNRIISLSPTIHYKLEQHVVSVKTFTLQLSCVESLKMFSKLHSSIVLRFYYKNQVCSLKRARAISCSHIGMLTTFLNFRKRYNKHE